MGNNNIIMQREKREEEIKDENGMAFIFTHDLTALFSVDFYE